VFKAGTLQLFILGVGAALFYPMYYVPLTSKVFDVIGESQKTAKLRVEYVVTRELALNVGRVASIALFLIVVSRTTEVDHLKWILFAVGFAQVFAALFMRRVHVVPVEDRSA
jgi:YQGE family putative transporter